MDTQTPQTVIEAEEVFFGGSSSRETTEVLAAWQDISARGRVRERKYRMRWNGAEWEYFAHRRLRAGFHADDRHDQIAEHVEIGSLLAEHAHGGEISRVLLVTASGVQELAFGSAGRLLHITMPSGAVVELPDPRRR